MLVVAISPSTQSAIGALREVAGRHGRDARIAEESSPWEELDPYDPPTYEAIVVIDGAPQIEVRLYAHEEDRIEIDDVVSFDVDREHVPAFVDAVLRGNVTIKSVSFPPSATLRIHLPGDVVYQEGLSYPDLLGGKGWISTVRSA